MTHRGEDPPPRTRVGGPLENLRRWYVRDINISRRIGWEHGGPPDRFVKIYEAVDELLKVFVPKQRLDAMDMGERFKELLQTMNGVPTPEQKGTFPPLLNKSLFNYEDEPEPQPHRKVPRLGELEAGLTEIFGAWLPGKREFTGPVKDPKLNFSSTTGTRPSPPRSPGQGRRMAPAPQLTDWTVIVNQMVDLVGGPVLGPGQETSPLQEQDRNV